MDFAKTKLLNDQLVKNAFDILTTSKLSKNGQLSLIDTAAILSAECVKKDPELIAAVLLSGFELSSDASLLKHLTPRIENIVKACTPTDALPLGDLNSSFGTELKILNIAFAIAVIESELPMMEFVYSVAFPLVDIFKDTSVAYPRNEDIQQMKQNAHEIISQMRESLVPLLGATGETKVEERFLKAYNQAAKLVGEPVVARPVSKQPPASKPPTP